jgi:two-component system sensor histidine kinase KdpD
MGAKPMPSERRLDPDSLLSRLQQQAAREARGRLKIFFGASAGVGKSYAMLEAARKQAAAGVDVVVGYVELHGRAETESLLEGLELLPGLALEHRGIQLREFDLDAALLRHPKLLLVDELAHANHAGARHAKRWQDVVELLDAGIDVYTTVNVQHLESLNDVVAQITGVQVRETFPDSVFEMASEVELIDLPPDDLLERIREGKVYTGDKAAKALDRFFRKGNLIALRQLALRATADRVDAAMREYRDDHAISDTWPANERVLVCVGPDGLSERLVRRARRMAFALHTDWIAVYVETPRLQLLSQADRDRVLRTLKMAESLGAESLNLSGESVAAELIALARQRNVSKIIVGKPVRMSWRDRLRGSLVDELIRRSEDIDVYVINGEPGEAAPVPPDGIVTRSSHARSYVYSCVLVAGITGLCSLAFGHIELANLVMVYLLGIVVAAARFGRGPSVLAAVLSVGLFDFLFVRPIYSFAVADTQYLITFGVMLTVGLLVSRLTAQGRRQAAVARHRERRTAELFALSRELSIGHSIEGLAAVLCRHVTGSIDGEATVLFPDAEGRVQDPQGFCTRISAGITRYPVPGNELGIAQWAFDHRQAAGRQTTTLASANAIYVPLNALDHVIGVLALWPSVPRQLEIPEQRHLLDALVSQTAVAMERVQLTAAARGICGPSVERPQPNTRLHSTDIGTLIGHVVARMRDSSAEHPLHERIAPDLPPACVDDVLIEQVLTNLLTYAGDHSPVGAAIEIEAALADRWIVVGVRDFGPSFDSGDEHVAFDRAHRGGQGRRIGLGLGIALCRAIVEAHGGSIHARNLAEGGVRFSFTVPIAR